MGHDRTMASAPGDVGGEPTTARRLLDAAVAAIDEGGEPAVKVQDIVTQAGVAIPALYRHFGSREGLVQAAQADRLQRDLANEISLITAAMEHVHDAASCRAVVTAALHRATTDERTEPRWRRVNVIGSTYGRPELTEEVAAIQGRSMRALREVMRRPHESGWFRPGLDLDAAAVWMAGQIVARFLQDLSLHDPAGPLAPADAFDELWISTAIHLLFGDAPTGT